MSVLGVATAIIAACVGDDPSSGPTGTDGGNGSSSGGDSGTDAGDCANVNFDNDAKNCGSCGHDCMHGACTSGVCQPWVLITADAGTVYGPGTKDRVPIEEAPELHLRFARWVVSGEWDAGLFRGEDGGR